MPEPSNVEGGCEMFRDDSLERFRTCAAVHGLRLDPVSPVVPTGQRPFEWEMAVFARADIHLFEVMREADASR